MRPSSSPQGKNDLFRERLDQIIRHDHPLVKLSKQIDWQGFDAQFGRFYRAVGRPAKPTRLLVGLHYLKHTYNLSDDNVVERWVENPYWQYFCGFEYFQHELPLDASSMTRWRKRIGSEDIARLLQESIHVALSSGAVRPQALERVNVDTTVQPKAIAYPTDSRLYQKALELLVTLARKHNIELRQTYVRVGKTASLMAGRYAHAQQFKRMHKQLKLQRTYLGRVCRNVERKIAERPDLQQKFSRLLGFIWRLLEQKPKDKNKLYSLHAPEVVCFSKGKARHRYEFGSKVGIVATSEGNLILAAKAFEGNPYDGHTLEESLKQATQLSGVEADYACVDRGYKGHGYEGSTKILISGQKQGLTPTLKRLLKRRSGIEPIIGHTKNDGRLGRNYLSGHEGDVQNALLSAAGYNLRLILRHLASFYVWIMLLFSYRKQKISASSF